MNLFLIKPFPLSRKHLASVTILIFAIMLGQHSFATQQAAPYLQATRYNSVGQVTGIIHPDPDGTGPLRYPALRNTYNTKGQLTLIESGELYTWQDETVKPNNWNLFSVFNQTVYTYDSAGRQLTVQKLDQNNAPITLTQYSYTRYNQVECKTVRMNPGIFNNLPVNACALGSEGTEGPDRITRYEYNNREQVEREYRAVGTPLEQVYQQYHYDSHGRLTGLTDANGNYTELRYDTNFRLERRVYPSKSVTGELNESDYNQYIYDNNGNIIRERKRNSVNIYYSYDNLNRPTFKNQPGTVNDVYYRYDLRGLNLYSRFGSASGQGITNTFDGLGNLKTTTTTMGGTSRTLSYAYDNNGNRTRITHPDNVYFGYSFDGIDRVNGVTENASSLITLTYRPNGRRHTLSRAGSGTTTYTFDDASRLESFEQNFYGTSNDLTNSFSYNPASQVTSLNLSNNLFRYQGNENRQGSYTPNGLNQYTHIAGQPLSYDTNGNLTNDGSMIYTYDHENRLTSTSGAATSSFKYDPLGRLYEATVKGTTTRFLYDGDALVAEYSSAGTLTRRYVHGDQVDEPWVQYNSAMLNYERRYLYADHQGSIIAHSDYMGSVSNRLTYDAYGIPGSANIDRFGYTGQIWFKDLGLFHYKARMYHPKLGRFLQTDPIFYADQMNMYAYVGNDPVNYIDPTGESRRKGDKSGIATSNLIARGVVAVTEPGSPVNTYAQRVVDTTQAAITGKNRVKVTPVREAEGPHSTWKTDPKTGEITRTETYTPNPQNPTGQDKVKSVDITGAPHRNKETGEAVPTPHVQGSNDDGTPIPGGVRPATPAEIPTPPPPTPCVSGSSAC